MYNNILANPWVNIDHFALPTNALNEWGKATAEFYQRLTQQNLDWMGEHCSRKSDQLKRLTHIRKPEDLINLQKDCFNEDMRELIESSQRWIHASIENMEYLTRMYESTVHDINPHHRKVKERH